MKRFDQFKSLLRKNSKLKKKFTLPVGDFFLVLSWPWHKKFIISLEGENFLRGWLRTPVRIELRIRAKWKL
jgi:hypothetical protein